MGIAKAAGIILGFRRLLCGLDGWRHCGLIINFYWRSQIYIYNIIVISIVNRSQFTVSDCGGIPWCLCREQTNMKIPHYWVASGCSRLHQVKGYVIIIFDIANINTVTFPDELAREILSRLSTCIHVPRHGSY